MTTRDTMTYKIIGAAMEVHRVIGCGFTEKVYQDALEQEFIAQGIQYEREVRMRVVYKGVELKTEFVPDFVCYGRIIVELKAVECLDDLHRAQTINYLHVSNMKAALLLNFGARSMQYERFNTPTSSAPL